MNLLYEANKDDLRSIAVYDHEGNLMAAEPVDSQKKGVDVGEQECVSQARDEAENIYRIYLMTVRYDITGSFLQVV